MPLDDLCECGGPAFAWKRTFIGVAVVALALATTFAAALGQVARRGHIQGKAIAVDGDTLKIGRLYVRLVGIDAPEIGQYCRNRKGNRYPCGEKARSKLQSLLKKGRLYCQRRGGDGRGRELAECWVLGKNRSITNINEVMVMAGMAFAFTKYSEEYVALEDLAKANRAGLWSGAFEFPWEYREKQKPLTAERGQSLFASPVSSEACPSRAPYCKNIRSCSRACFLLKCGFTRLDRDRDGIPCENVCRRRCP